MKKIIAILIIVFSSYFLFAHEYVLLAYKYHVQKGDTLEMHLFVADGFNVQLERPLQKGITQKFELITTTKTFDLLNEAKDEALPVVNMKVDFDGHGLLHMERDYARIALPTKQFREYLKEDHLDNIHIPADEPEKPQREKYSRYIKALVQSGNQHDTLYKKILGQNFEIILLQDPYQLHAGGSLQAQILFMGKPLVNKTITARNRTGSESALALTSKTNANGICSFKLMRKGEWFIHATHMVPSADKTDSDWDSFWTSYSFAVE